MRNFPFYYHICALILYEHYKIESVIYITYQKKRVYININKYIKTPGPYISSAPPRSPQGSNSEKFHPGGPGSFNCFDSTSAGKSGLQIPMVTPSIGLV